MKIGSVYKKCRNLVFLLGLAGLLLFTACQDVFDTAVKAPESGYGEVQLNFGDVDADAKTIYPGGGVLTGVDTLNIYFKGDNNSVIKKVVTKDPVSGSYSVTFELPLGNYTAYVEAFTTSGSTLVAIGTSEQFEISSSIRKTLSITLEPTGTGTLDIALSFPANATYTVTLDRWNAAGEKVNVTLASPTIGSDPSYNPAGQSYSLSTSSLAGSAYLVTVKINTIEAKYGGFTEVVHVSTGLTTTYSRKFIDADLAQIITAEDAVKHLEDQIEGWIKKEATNVTVLAAYGTGSTVLPIVIDSAAKKTSVYYVQSKAPSKVTFPIALEGGWTLPGQTFDLPPAGKTISLENTQMDGATQIFKATYTVELVPVAEFHVSAGKAGSQNVSLTGRTVAIDNLSPNNAGAGTFGGGPIAAGASVCTSLTGSTKLTITNAAILLDSAAVTPNAQGVYDLPAISRVYNIVIYETVTEQATNAFNDLRLDFAKADQSSYIVQTVALAKDAAVPTMPAFDLATPNTLKSTLYYVQSRIPSGITTFEFNLPSDTRDPVTGAGIPGVPNDRWSHGSYSIAQGSAYPQTTTSINLTFTPFGGSSTNVYNYTVDVVPVAEFYVTYKTDYYNQKPLAGANLVIKTTTDPFDSTGKKFEPVAEDVVWTHTPGGAANGPATALADKPKIALLDSTTITLSNVTITLNYDNGIGGTNFPHPGIDSPTAGMTTPITFDTKVAIVTPGTDPIRGSKEYNITVYTSAAEQRKAAFDKIDAVDTVAKLNDSAHSGTDSWITLVDITNDEVVGFLKRGTTNDFRDIRYTSKTTTATTAPTIAIPAGLADFAVGPVGSPAWTVAAAASAPNDVDAVGGSTYEFKFKPLGAVDDKIFSFNLIPVAKFVVNFKKGPTNLNANGTVTFTGASVLGETVSGNNGVSPYNVTKADTDTNRSATFILGLTKTAAATTIASNSAGGDLVSIESGNKGALATIAATAARTYNIDVYPSLASQKSTALAAMRQLVNPAGWVIKASTNELEGVLEFKRASASGDLLATDNTSELKFIGTGVVTVAVPDAGLDTNPMVLPNADYRNSTPGTQSWGWNAPSDGSITADSTNGTYGAYGAKFTFVPIGVAANTTTPSDVQEYNFRIIRVAKYVVDFRMGPVNNSVSGEVKITVKAPGSAVATATPQSIGHGSAVKTIYGAVADVATNSTFEIAATGDNNILLLDVGSTIADNKTGVSSYTAANASSTTYTIRVYPTIAAQNDAVIDLLSKVVSNTGWFTAPSNATNFTFVSNLTKDTTAVNESNMTYFYKGNGAQNNAPVVNVLADAIDADYTNQLTIAQVPAFDSNTAGTPNTLGKDAATFSFTAIGQGTTAGTPPTPVTYKFNLIRLAKYKLEFAGSSSGTVSVRVSTPGTNGDPTSSTTNTELKVIGSANDAFVYGGIGTKPVFSVANGNYDDVTIYQGNITNIKGSFLPNTTAASKTTTDVVEALEYTVRLFK